MRKTGRRKKVVCVAEAERPLLLLRSTLLRSFVAATIECFKRPCVDARVLQRRFNDDDERTTENLNDKIEKQKPKQNLLTFFFERVTKNSRKVDKRGVGVT